ncbi:MAG: serine/threonine protein kinase [Deltaproteobacteria bacterium]|nr:serine/threonine protein kinase [Deltaproteobacteria bacterium]
MAAMRDAGRYTLLRKFADGGMAEIYLGLQQGPSGFQRPVVVKAIREQFTANPHLRHTLVDEAHVAMSLRHSNIVQVLDLGSASGRDFLILELVDGWDLDRILYASNQAKLPLPQNLALHIAAEVCRALSYAHARTSQGKPRGIVHRDVSPHNILVSEHGEVKLTDFGIAHVADKREQTVAGIIKGKVNFMSPEQAAGEPLDARSDLFALGSVIYLMVTGKLPFATESELETLLRTKEARFTAPSEVAKGVDPEVESVILEALRRDRAERFPTADAMLERIEKALRSGAFPPTSQTELKRWIEELAKKANLSPVGRLSMPPPEELGDADFERIDGSDLVLIDIPADLQAAADVVHISLPPQKLPDAIAHAPPPLPAARPPALSIEPHEAKWKRNLKLSVMAVTAVAVMWGMHDVLAGLESHSSPDRPPKPVAQLEPKPTPPAPAPIPDPPKPSPVVVEASPPKPPDPEPAELPQPDLKQVALEPVKEPAKPAEDESTVSVRFVSDPAGAQVRVEKRAFGATPINVRVRPNLTYDVEFDLAGYEPTHKRVFVAQRKNQSVQISLKRR